MNNIYIRREGLPQKCTKAYKGDKGWSGLGGDPLPKAFGFIYSHKNSFKMMNVFYFT